MSEVSDIERNSLDAHVELCAMRYHQLDTRLNILEVKVDALNSEIERSRHSMAKTIIMATTGIISSVLGLIVTVLMKF